MNNNRTRISEIFLHKNNQEKMVQLKTKQLLEFQANKKINVYF